MPDKKASALDRIISTTVMWFLAVTIMSIVGYSVLFLLRGCERSAVRSYGGTLTVNLPKNKKLINVTWKGNELWYLSRPRRTDEPIETFTFHEDSAYGVIEGDVVLKEH